jgi:membrane protein DedA with SNARE-associated domain
MGIFLSRWLITPAGPWVNLMSGASKYPWLRFVLWDVVGEVLWVVLYVYLGRVVAGEVQAISSRATSPGRRLPWWSRAAGLRVLRSRWARTASKFTT